MAVKNVQGPDPGAAHAVRRVVVKMQQAAPPPPAAGAAIEAFGGDRFAEIAHRYPGLRVRPYFEAAPPAGGAFAAEVGVPPPGVLPGLERRRYLSVELEPGAPAEELARDMRNQPGVETAYVEAGPVPPPVSPSDDPRSARQGYLDPAPAGVDARFAWDFGPVDGDRVGFVDLERGWTLDHQDLAAAAIALISGVNQDFHGHGTAVLGEVAAADNTLGCIGIAPAVTTRVVSQWRGNGIYGTAEAIVSAAAVMAAGDVLLLEAQTTFVTHGETRLPVEAEPAVFDAIRAATQKGVIVIEAAGNGQFNLDQFQDLDGKHTLRRGAADFRDSGAIVVGAASSGEPHARMSFSNFGSRVDCFAWGENVTTCGDGGTGTGVQTYTDIFDGTSSASPIIAGCAVLLQHWRDLNNQPRFTPSEMRAWLSSVALNTPSANPGGDRIGPMPNLRAMIEALQHDPAAALPPQTVLE